MTGSFHRRDEREVNLIGDFDEMRFDVIEDEAAIKMLGWWC